MFETNIKTVQRSTNSSRLLYTRFSEYITSICLRNFWYKKTTLMGEEYEGLMVKLTISLYFKFYAF